jgi:hypothetical protein
VLKKVGVDPVWSKVIANAIWYAGAAVVTAVVTAVIVYFGGWWPYIAEWRSHLATIASEIGLIVADSTIVPNWLFIPICLLAAIGAVHLGKALYRGVKPDWRDYRQDTFFGIVWRWGYEGGNLLIPIPFCPHCDTQMDQGRDSHYTPQRNRTVYHCSHCDNRIPVNHSHDAILKKVILQIGRKIRQMGK